MVLQCAVYLKDKMELLVGSHKAASRAREGGDWSAELTKLALDVREC